MRTAVVAAPLALFVAVAVAAIAWLGAGAPWRDDDCTPEEVTTTILSLAALVFMWATAGLAGAAIPRAVQRETEATQLRQSAVTALGTISGFILALLGLVLAGVAFFSVTASACGGPIGGLAIVFGAVWVLHVVALLAIVLVSWWRS